MENCPFCGSEVAYRCRCMRGDFGCNMGHNWHYCSEHPGNLVGGEADHAAEGCSCIPGNTYRLEGKLLRKVWVKDAAR